MKGRKRLKAAAALMTVIFVSASVSVCLHGPERDSCDDEPQTGMPLHSTAASAVDDSAGTGAHRHADDHHFCPCVCHVPVFVDSSGADSVRTAVRSHVGTTVPDLLPGHTPEHYRPPIANS